MNWLSRINNAHKEICLKNGLKIKPQNTGFYKIKTIAQKIETKEFHFLEWVPSIKPKKDGGHRIIIVPPFSDRIVLKALTEYLAKKLTPIFKKVENVSFAYQKGRSVRDALIHLKSLYAEGNIILKVDIRKFFDTINKDILKDLLTHYHLDESAYSLILQSLSPKLKNNDNYEEALIQIQNGIPQGNSVSSVLSNLYLLELDKLSLTKRLKMIRYADDIIFICKNEDEAFSTLKYIENYLSTKRKLQIHPLSDGNPNKTVIIKDCTKSRLVYLGIEFDGKRLFPTTECQNKLIERVRCLIGKKSFKLEKITTEITSSISQWCGYYAFTDITNSRLSSLSKKINHYGKYQFGDDWIDVDLIEVMKRCCKRQNNKLLKRIYPQKFDETYNWVIVYP